MIIIVNCWHWVVLMLIDGQDAILFIKMMNIGNDCCYWYYCHINDEKIVEMVLLN